MADVIAKLKVDTKDYDGGLSKATKRLDDFTKQNTSLNGIMSQGITTLTKFAGGFAAVEIAAKAFNAVILNGSQVTGDFVRNGVGALNDTLGVLASSIATLDFTPFIGGLGDVYRQALAAREALDSLGDTLRGLGISSSDAREAIAELRAVNADSTSTDEQKAKALEDANAAVKDYKEVIQATITETNNWINSSVKAASGLKGVETTAEDVKKAVVDYAKHDSEGKKQIVANAREIQASYNKLLKDREALNPKPTHMGYKKGIHSGYSKGGTQEEKDALDAEIAEFEQNNASALRQFVLFDKMNDEAADRMAQNVSNLSEYNRGVARMEKQLNDAQKTVASTSGVSTPKVSTPKASGGGKSTSKTQESFTSNLQIKDFAPIDPLPAKDFFDKAVPSMEQLQNLAKYWNKQMNEATSQDQFLAAENALKKIERDIELQPIALRGGISIEEAAEQERLQAQADDMELKIKADIELNKESFKNADGLSDSGKSSQKSWEAASRAISSAGNALQELNNTSFNIAGTIMQAIADVALSMAQALASPATGAAGIFGWIAGAAAGTATMIATIAAIKSATSGSYAQGGIVPGAYNGGLDSTYVYASPGEVILNRAQQENLLSQLEPATASGGVSYVSGEQLITVINNTGRRRGRGELLFSK